MRAVRLHAPRTALRLEDVPLPQPSGTEVRVRVAGAGVCHTDLHVVEGLQPRIVLPRTLGHEVAGWLDAAADDATELLREPGLRSGDPVLVYGGWGCGHCAECAAGAEQRCANSVAPGFQTDGGYAEAMLVPHPRHLVPLRSLDPIRAAPLADAAVTPYRAVQRALPWLRDGGRVLVIGVGALGQFAIQLLRIVANDGPTLRIAAVDPDPARRTRAIELGADVVMPDANPAAAIEALGGPPDVVLDIVGSDATLVAASEAVAPGGAVLLIGEAGGELAFGMERPSIEAWLTTVAWGSRADLGAVVTLAEAGRLEWTVETMPLADAARAHDRLRAGDVEGRIVLVP